jgi:hypothetical protein
MNATEEEAVMTPHESVEFYIPLVKEYADKLAALCARASDLRYHAAHTGGASEFVSEAARLIELYECLKPVVEQLIRRTATILDLAKIGRDNELALALRQEELEAHFRFAPVVFGELESTFGSKKIRAIIDKTRINVVN